MRTQHIRILANERTVSSSWGVRGALSTQYSDTCGSRPHDLWAQMWAQRTVCTILQHPPDEWYSDTSQAWGNINLYYYFDLDALVRIWKIPSKLLYTVSSSMITSDTVPNYWMAVSVYSNRQLQWWLTHHSTFHYFPVLILLLASLTGLWRGHRLSHAPAAGQPLQGIKPPSSLTASVELSPTQTQVRVEKIRGKL